MFIGSVPAQVQFDLLENFIFKGLVMVQVQVQ